MGNHRLTFFVFFRYHSASENAYQALKAQTTENCSSKYCKSSYPHMRGCYDYHRLLVYNKVLLIADRAISSHPKGFQGPRILAPYLPPLIPPLTCEINSDGDGFRTRDTQTPQKPLCHRRHNKIVQLFYIP